jgi:hypothetical protein
MMATMTVVALPSLLWELYLISMTKLGALSLAKFAFRPVFSVLTGK